MRNDEIVQEYLRLCYFSSREHKEKDYLITDHILLRASLEGWKIIYLNTGISLEIDWKWIDLFYELYCYAGDEISWRTDRDFISLMVRLQSFILGGIDKLQSGEKFLTLLAMICDIGTKDFIKKYPELKLKPFLLRRTADTLEI